MKWALSALSPIYYGIHKLRNQLYSKNLLEKIRTKAKVISVGNISFGGTGKTPFVMWLLRQDFLRDKKVAVVGRPYKANYQGEFHLIGDYDFERSADYGDEAVMIARNLPWVDVYVGKSKADCAYLADKQEEYDLIVLDDGFQHRRLERDLDIVLLDSSVEASDYKRVPQGKLREDVQALGRADLCVFTKIKEGNDFDKFKVAENFRLPLVPEVGFGFELGKPTRFLPGMQLEVLEPSPGSYILATGVGNPRQVKKSITDFYGESLADKVFEDHYQFTSKDAEELEVLREESGAKYIFCTEKDYFKLRSVMKNASNLYYIPLNFKCISGQERLVEKVRTLFS